MSSNKSRDNNPPDETDDFGPEDETDDYIGTDELLEQILRNKKIAERGGDPRLREDYIPPDRDDEKPRRSRKVEAQRRSDAIARRITREAGENESPGTIDMRIDAECKEDALEELEKKRRQRKQRKASFLLQFKERDELNKELDRDPELYDAFAMQKIARDRMDLFTRFQIIEIPKSKTANYLHVSEKSVTKADQFLARRKYIFVRPGERQWVNGKWIVGPDKISLHSFRKRLILAERKNRRGEE